MNLIETSRLKSAFRDVSQGMQEKAVFRAERPVQFRVSPGRLNEDHFRQPERRPFFRLDGANLDSTESSIGDSQSGTYRQVEPDSG